MATDKAPGYYFRQTIEKYLEQLNQMKTLRSGSEGTRDIDEVIKNLSKILVQIGQLRSIENTKEFNVLYSNIYSMFVSAGAMTRSIVGDLDKAASFITQQQKAPNGAGRGFWPRPAAK